MISPITIIPQHIAIGQNHAIKIGSSKGSPILFPHCLVKPDFQEFLTLIYWNNFKVLHSGLNFTVT